ncbi:glycosyltransferase, partial [Burkholderia gladioli]
MSGAAAAAAPRVSVVVPSFRRPPMLARCLEALCAQDLPPASYEIVVVDDDDAGSALDTVDDCRERHADGPPIRYCLAAGTQGPAAARNLGWR